MGLPLAQQVAYPLNTPGQDQALVDVTGPAAAPPGLGPGMAAPQAGDRCALAVGQPGVIGLGLGGPAVPGAVVGNNNMDMAAMQAALVE